MTNPTPGTQLDRVLSLMQDGQWRSPAEIAQATGDREHSVTSRIRDLRLPMYGGHQVESRKRNVTRQIWEYRLVSSSANTPNNSSPSAVTTFNPTNYPASNIWPVSGNTQNITPMQMLAQQALGNVSVAGPPIKFLNMDTMMVEQIERDRCRVDSSHGFDRVVAVDDSGNILTNLVTTQETL